MTKQIQGYFRQCQLDLIKDNINDPNLKLKLMHIIDENNLRHHYCVQSNVYLNDKGIKAYLDKQDYYSMRISKHQFKQTLIELSKSICKQFKHIGFDNSLGYVRFVYGVKTSK